MARMIAFDILFPVECHGHTEYRMQWAYIPKEWQRKRTTNGLKEQCNIETMDGIHVMFMYSASVYTSVQYSVINIFFLFVSKQNTICTLR